MHDFQFEIKYRKDTKTLYGTIIRESKWKGKYCFGAVL